MRERETYEIRLAPLQGYTDRIYRCAFEHFFGGIAAYYTPFIRLEKGEQIRNKDLRDIDTAEKQVENLIPQILPGNASEFRFLVHFLQEKGYRRIDINLGCPFPMIAGKRKGAGLLPYPELIGQILEGIESFPKIRFSVKMRLGWNSPGECLCLIPLLNTLRLDSVCLHARLGKQQYKGVPDLEAFEQFYTACRLPLFYNGDLKTPEGIEEILIRFPLLRGVLIGRGLLSSPLLAKDFYQNETFSATERISRFAAFHEALFFAYAKRLEGENQLLNKIKSLWEYFLPEMDRKCRKRILKATRIAGYRQAVEEGFSSRKNDDA